MFDTLYVCQYFGLVIRECSPFIIVKIVSDGTLQQSLDTDCPNVRYLNSTLVVTIHDMHCTLTDLLSTMLVDWPIIGLSACFAKLLIFVGKPVQA